MDDTRAHTLHGHALFLHIVHKEAELNLVFVQNVLHHAAAVAVSVRVP